MQQINLLLTTPALGCADVVKKPKLDQHRARCDASFTCIDCSKTFPTPVDWKGTVTHHRGGSDVLTISKVTRLASQKRRNTKSHCTNPNLSVPC